MIDQSKNIFCDGETNIKHPRIYMPISKDNVCPYCSKKFEKLKIIQKTVKNSHKMLDKMCVLP